MSQRKLIIASHNEGKVGEIRELLRPLGFEIRSAKDARLPEPEETGETFEENAALKAQAAARRAKSLCLADDSGLVIPALDGAPGIYSARWTGEDKTFQTAFERIQQELAAKGINEEEPVEAYFICVLCLAMPGGQARYFEGRVHGHLTFPPQGELGFGYDPIFIPENHQVTFAQMPAQQKNEISHRARALQELKYFFQSEAA